MLLFLANTFRSDNPPGWYVQQLPVNDLVNDIFFLDSLNGWLVTNGRFNENDTSYIMRTTNGGDNWTIQNAKIEKLNAVQFLDVNTGYAAGGLNRTTAMSFYKTINGGINWKALNNIGGVAINDMFFVNKDTGWICDPSVIVGGLYKTTNGGVIWVQQLDVNYKIQKIFFLNKDTGWAGSNEVNGKLYRTTIGGVNWNLQFTSAFHIEAIFFLTPLNGWMRGGPDLNGNGASYTTDGGFKWISSQGNIAGGYDVKFVNDSIGYSGMIDGLIAKSTDGGRTWGSQASPIFNNLSIAIIKSDTVHAWAGGSGIAKTNDGGGPIMTGIELINNLAPDNYKLYQNYPNPFNPKTIINYELGITNYVELKIYDILGNEITALVNEKQSAGSYSVEFDGSNLSSGIYFYRLETENFIDTKKMILTK